MKYEVGVPGVREDRRRRRRRASCKLSISMRFVFLSSAPSFLSESLVVVVVVVVRPSQPFFFFTVP